MTVFTNSSKIAEIRVSRLKILLFGIILAIITTLLCLWLADILGYNPQNSDVWDYPLIVALLIPLAVVHELLHGLAAILFGKIHWNDLRFGISWRHLAAVCHLKAPISVKAARIVGIAPLTVTAPLTFIILLVYPTRVTTILAAITLAACVGDLLMIHELRKFDSNQLFLDHPSEPGFDIYDPRRISAEKSADQ